MVVLRVQTVKIDKGFSGSAEGAPILRADLVASPRLYKYIGHCDCFLFIRLTADLRAVTVPGYAKHALAVRWVSCLYSLPGQTPSCSEQLTSLKRTLL